MNKLAHCPFCGYSAHRESVRDWLLWGRKYWYIECNYCFATTNFCKTLTEAEAAWNERT